MKTRKEPIYKATSGRISAAVFANKVFEVPSAVGSAKLIDALADAGRAAAAILGQASDVVDDGRPVGWLRALAMGGAPGAELVPGGLGHGSRGLLLGPSQSVRREVPLPDPGPVSMHDNLFYQALSRMVGDSAGDPPASRQTRR